MQKNKYAIFFCFDRAYRIPGLVAVMSVIRAVKEGATKPDILIFLPHNEMPFWQGLAKTLAANTRYPKLVIICTTLTAIPASAEYYGFATPRRLPKIVFGRLFAVLELQRLGYARALYLDADTITFDDVTPLFFIHQMGHALSAILERGIGLVLQAIRMHKIANGKYFNSGVMLFDLKHPEILTLIEGAISSIGDPNVTLLFHDQCALNRAASGSFHVLSPRYNSFFLPGMKTPVDMHACAIVHFIDTPKPWDAKYRGNGCLVWHQQWQRTSAELCGLGMRDDEIEGPVLKQGVDESSHGVQVLHETQSL